MTMPAAVVLLLLGSLAGRSAAADPPGTPRSREALSLCHRAQDAAPAEQPALLAQSLAAADAAVAADDHDALAHFARFCALGEEARIAGVGIRGLVALPGLRQAADRTLALAPDFPDALLGKGALLLATPRVLGGDAAEGERLVRRALEVDPDYFDARVRLAEALAEQGRPAAARAEARRALATAEREGSAADAAAARALLATLPP